MSNPILSRIGTAAQQQPRYSVPGQAAPAGYGAPVSYGAPVGYDASTGYGTPTGHPETVPTGTPDVMTIDDVVVKTITLLGTIVLTAAATWALVPDTALYTTWIAALGIGFVLGLVISFAQVTNPFVLLAYAAVEGVFLGAVSKAYESFFDGIVLNAVIATLGVFLTMALLYKLKIIRATPKFMKVVIGATVGLAVVMVINLIYYFISGSVSPLRDGGPLAIGFSLVCIVIAALMFVVNFKQIEDGVAAGLPRKYGWLGAFGIVVELVWLYLEILRLLSYFMSED